MKIGLFINKDDDVLQMERLVKKWFKNSTIIKCNIPQPMFNGESFDLAIIDYGDLTSIPGNSLGEHYAMYINEYAENHPNTLILYITVMGASYLKTEGLNLEGLANIKWCDSLEIKKEWDAWDVK